MNGVRPASPRFETDSSSKKTYISFSTPRIESKAAHGKVNLKTPYVYSLPTAPAHLHEKYNGFAATTSSQAWRAQEILAARESQPRASTVIACQGTQRSASCNGNPRTGQRSEMGAFEHLAQILYDDLNRDEFDVYLKKEN